MNVRHVLLLTLSMYIYEKATIQKATPHPLPQDIKPPFVNPVSKEDLRLDPSPHTAGQVEKSKRI